MSLALSAERQVAISAVRRACALTSSVFNNLAKNEVLTKDDKSPATVADYSAQAVVNVILNRAFPKDPIVGEEDAQDLQRDGALANRIAQLANEALTAELENGENAEWGIGPGQTRSVDELLEAIGRGNHNGGSQGRMWTLDPIDGTKGFLRGEQYAVCLALIVDAQVQLGVIGCPNLPHDASNPGGPRGCLFIAVDGQGAQQYTLSGATNPIPLFMPPTSPDGLIVLESVEGGHSSHSLNNRISSILGITRPSIRMDSQAKYCVLSRGDGGLYLRMPANSYYEEKIWDHAAADLLVREAGGIVSDARGVKLNFGLGRTLGKNYGIVATRREVHSVVIEAIQRALAEGKSQ